MMTTFGTKAFGATLVAVSLAGFAAPSAAETGAPPAAPKYSPPPPPGARPAPQSPAASPQPTQPSRPASPAQLPAGSAPRAVTVARTTRVPRCTVFVDSAGGGRGDGSIQSPHQTIATAINAAAPGAVICVAEGTYSEQIKPGEKYFTLAGGFQRGSGFKVRDSAAHVSRITGKGGSFIRYDDAVGPKAKQLTAIDGFDISGFSQAIARDYWESQQFEVTNNHIHDNRCDSEEMAGAGVALSNVSGRIEGNVFRNNRCGRGGAIFYQDAQRQNAMTLARNLVDDNHGTEPGASHGGAVYLFGKLQVIGNLFTRNSVTQWGGGLYIGAWTEGNQFTTATLSWNVYRDNRAGNGGGGMFCDNGATCNSYHEVYDRNCGSNILLDSGTPSGPTTARFYHMTNVGALDVGCKGPGAGVRIDIGSGSPDNYAFINSLFWGNAPGIDFVATCDQECGKPRVTVSYSMVQTRYLNQGLKISFGEGIMAPVDPLFANPANGDFHLKSQAGRWTLSGRVQDPVSSPALGKGFAGGKAADNPERAGPQIELGAYGNSGEASFVR